MAQFTRANGPMLVNTDESPLFGQATTLDGTKADVNTVGLYELDARMLNDQAREERCYPASSSS